MSFSFDGVDDYFTNAPGAIGNTQMTFFIAMKPTSYGEQSRAHLITQGTGADSSPRVNWLFGDGYSGVYANSIRLTLHHATAPAIWTTPYDPAQLGKWQSAAFSLDHALNANDPTMYFNGQSTPMTRQGSPSGAWDADGLDFYFGNNSGQSRTFLGLINTLAVWTRVLAPSEHALIHYCGVRKVLRGLAFWYRFSSGMGFNFSGSPLSLGGAGPTYVGGAEGDRLATGG